MIRRLDHVAFAVNDVEKAVEQALKYGGEYLFTSRVDKDGYLVAAVRMNECVLTFLQPFRDDSFVKDFLDAKGEAVHHIGIEVENIEEYVSKLESAGIKVPVRELEEGTGRKEVLVGPRHAFGVVFQLIEWAEGADVSLEQRIARFIKYRT